MGRLTLWAMATTLIVSCGQNSGQRTLFGGVDPDQAKSDGVDFQVRSGDETDFGDYPFVGALVFSTGDSSSICSGSLLDSTTVVSAAHCTFASGVPIAAGDFLFTNRVNESSPGQVVEVTDVRRHPDFDPDAAIFQARHDVAVFTLATPIELDEYAILPRARAFPSIVGPVNVSTTVVGYGLEGEGGAGIQREGIMWYQSHSADEQLLFFGPGPQNQLSCGGDSGGPAIKGTNTLIGLSSFGNGDCVARNQAAFTSVFKNLAFIKNLEFQNPNNRHDVNDDGSVSPLDALVVINTLNRRGSGVLDRERDGIAGQDIGFVDVNGDKSVSAIDALQVINQLNQQSSSDSSVPSADITSADVTAYSNGDRAPVQNAFAQFAFEFDNSQNFRDSTNEFLNWGKRNEKWVFSRNSGWHFITADGKLYRWLRTKDDQGRQNGELVAVYTPDFYTDLTSLTSPEAPPGNSGGSEVSLEELAQQLDADFNLRFTSSYFENWGGLGEKFMYGNGGWYLITPDGKVYRWNGTKGGTGTLVGTLDASYHQDPAKLHEAAN